MAKPCSHQGEVEIRVIGMTDDVYTVLPLRIGFLLHNDMSEHQRFVMITCTECDEVVEAEAGSDLEVDPDIELPPWARLAVDWARDHQMEAE